MPGPRRGKAAANTADPADAPTLAVEDSSPSAAAAGTPDATDALTALIASGVPDLDLSVGGAQAEPAPRAPLPPPLPSRPLTSAEDFAAAIAVAESTVPPTAGVVPSTVPPAPVVDPVDASPGGFVNLEGDEGAAEQERIDKLINFVATGGQSAADAAKEIPTLTQVRHVPIPLVRTGVARDLVAEGGSGRWYLVNAAYYSAPFKERFIAVNRGDRVRLADSEQVSNALDDKFLIGDPDPEVEAEPSP